MKLLVFGSNGLVGNSLKRLFENSNLFTRTYFSTREDTNLFNFDETSKLISEFSPDIVINAAARVGGIYANNTERTDFLIENLKINLNILESCIPNNKIKVINLGSSCIYPLNAENPILKILLWQVFSNLQILLCRWQKLTAMKLGESLKIQYGHEVINLMPTNLYGPNDNFHQNQVMLYLGLIKRCIFSRIMRTVFQYGNLKTFERVSICWWFSLSIKFIIENNIVESLINIGSGEEISILSLAEKIQNIIGYKGKLIFDSSNLIESRKLLDSSLINNHGWKSSTTLDTV